MTSRRTTPELRAAGEQAVRTPRAPLGEIGVFPDKGGAGYSLFPQPALAAEPADQMPMLLSPKPQL